MENSKTTRLILKSISLALVILLILFRPQKNETRNQNELKTDLKTNTIGKNSKRTPASVEMIKAEIAKPEIVRKAINNSNFQDGTVQLEKISPNINNSFSQISFENSIKPASGNTKTNDSEFHSEPASKTNQPKAEEEKSVYGTYPPVSEKKVSSNKKDSNTTSTSSTASSHEFIPNTCSASISGGSFNHPIGVTLSCSTTSSIIYCISKDTGNGCCDPRVSGEIYTSKIKFGSINANYCLSFYGDSNYSGQSEIYQNNYNINSSLPDLRVGHRQNYYQTTQLSGNVYLSSNDFGKTGYGAGVINLKSHDPGALGENLNCDEIFQNYSSLLPPAPLDVLSLLDVSLENPAAQIEIPLRLEQLDYGTNFITGYMLNDNYDLPLFSCSTSEVVLSDFEFFEQQLSFGDPGNNSTREFTGGLTSFGFFEPETTVSRGPAGVSIEDQDGQRLQYGLLGIFF